MKMYGIHRNCLTRETFLVVKHTIYTVWAPDMHTHQKTYDRLTVIIIIIICLAPSITVLQAIICNKSRTKLVARVISWKSKWYRVLCAVCGVWYCTTVVRKLLMWCPNDGIMFQCCPFYPFFFSLFHSSYFSASFSFIQFYFWFSLVVRIISPKLKTFKILFGLSHIAF